MVKIKSEFIHLIDFNQTTQQSIVPESRGSGMVPSAVKVEEVPLLAWIFFYSLMSSNPDI